MALYTFTVLYLKDLIKLNLREKIDGSFYRMTFAWLYSLA